MPADRRGWVSPTLWWEGPFCRLALVPNTFQVHIKSYLWFKCTCVNIIIAIMKCFSTSHIFTTSAAEEQARAELAENENVRLLGAIEELVNIQVSDGCCAVHAPTARAACVHPYTRVLHRSGQRCRDAKNRHCYIYISFILFARYLL